jgi:hypothetical protein
MPAGYELEASYASRGAAEMKLLLPSQPVALPGSRSHLVAVAEAGGNRVSLLSTSGHFIRVLRAPMNAVEGSDRPLHRPMGVAIGDHGGETIIVA